MSFRLKTVLGIAVIEIVLLTVLVLSGLHYLKTSNEDQFQERAETTAQLLATMTTDAVVAFDLATLDSLVEEALKNRDIVYARVRGRDNTVLSEGGDDDVLSALNNSDIQITTDDRLDITSPILVSGTSFGFVDIGLDTRSLSSTLIDATKWMLGVASAEIVLVAVFGFALGSILTGQLQSLQRGAKRVADGELGYLIDVKGKDELADTAHSFNKMSASLAVYARQLEEAKIAAEGRRDLAESILHDAISSLSEGVVVADATGTVLHMNAAFKSLHAIDEVVALDKLDDRLFKDVNMYVAGTASVNDILSTPEVNAVARDVFSTAANDDIWTCRFTNERTIQYAANSMDNGGMVFVARDMSAIYNAELNARQLERELLQSQKLEAIGTLAGGIAHELNTPIQFVGDNLNFIGDACRDISAIVEQHLSLLDDLETAGQNGVPLGEMRDALQDADYDFLRDELPLAVSQSRDGVSQMANIILAMKEFAYPTQKEKAPVSLNRALERATLVSRNEWKYIAELDWELDDAAPDALVNEGELNQVILNLIVNAAHAIKEAGRDAGKIRLSSETRDGMVIIGITDNGTGIPKAVQNRVFDQFFTTKDVGKGTGQGLALCHEFISNRNDGRIYFDTSEGVGTTFYIELPLAQSNQLVDPLGPETAAFAVAGESKTI